MISAKKRVKINNTVNTKFTHSKNNYQRTNTAQLHQSIKNGRMVVAIGKANAYLQKRPVTPDNMSEPRFLSAINAKLLTNALREREKNITKKRKKAIENANINKLLRNINNERKINGGSYTRKR
jgi:hypothetical protein